MSIHIMSLVWERAPYEGGTLLALLALADWANDDGVTWPSVAQIATKSRMKPRNVQYILRTLETDGMLIREQTGKGRATTVYRINLATLNALPQAWKPSNARAIVSYRVQNEIQDEFVPMQNLHDATQCTPAAQPSAPLRRNDCTSPMQPSAPLGCTPVHPIRHRSVIDPSGDPPTPTEWGWEGSAYGGGEGTQSGTPRELGTNPRELESNPRAVAKQTAQTARAACGLCDVRGQVEVRREDDTVVMLRCPHNRIHLSAVMSAHAYHWPGAPPPPDPPSTHGPAP